MKTNPLKIHVLILIFLSLSSLAVAGGIKERMLTRQPVLVDMKNRGIIGEANTGYIGFVGQAREHEDVVAEENKDRKLIYTKIAEQQNNSPELVGKLRARQVVERIAKGHYYQNESGKWVLK